MENNVEFTVKPELLGAIKNILDREISALSPFHYEGKAPSAGLDQLISAGICNSNGEIVENYLQVIDALATPWGFTRLYFNNPANTFEYINYFTPGNRTISITNDEGTQKVNYPDINDKIIEGIGQNIGDTIYRNIEFDIDLSPGEALVLAAMMDIQRKAILKAIPDDKDIEPVKISKDKINKDLTSIDNKFQWMKNIMAKILEPATFTPNEIIPEALDGLKAKGLVVNKGSNYLLNEAAFYISRRMLVIDKTLTVTSGRLTSEVQLNLASFTCLQSGVHDILMIDAGSSNVNIKTLSSSALLDQVLFFLNGDFLDSEYMEQISTQPEDIDIMDSLEFNTPSELEHPGVPEQYQHAPPPPAPIHQQTPPVQHQPAPPQQAPPPAPIAQPVPPPPQHQQPVQQPPVHAPPAPVQQQAPPPPPPQNQQQPQQQPVQQAPPQQQQQFTCPQCGGPATYMAQTGGYYCYKCQRNL